jgi:hypothetical protein
MAVHRAARKYQPFSWGGFVMRRLIFHALIPLAMLAGLATVTVGAADAGGSSPRVSGAATVATGPSPIGPPVAIGVEPVATGLVSPVQLV